MSDKLQFVEDFNQRQTEVYRTFSVLHQAPKTPANPAFTTAQTTQMPMTIHFTLPFFFLPASAVKPMMVRTINQMVKTSSEAASPRRNAEVLGSIKGAGLVGTIDCICCT